MDLTRDLCAVCGAPIERARTGRPRSTCSDRCRQRRRRGVTKLLPRLAGPPSFVTRPGRTFRDDGTGVCVNCGRSWGGHAANSCYAERPGGHPGVDEWDRLWRLERGIRTG